MTIKIKKGNCRITLTRYGNKSKITIKVITIVKIMIKTVMTIIEKK